MKSTLLTVISLCCAVHIFAQAQINTSLSLLSNPPASLSNWPMHKNVLTYVCTYVSAVGEPFTAKIKAEIRLTDGTPVATIDLSKVSLLEFSGTRVFYAADVLPMGALRFSGPLQAQLLNSGKLPPGTYELSVQLVEPIDFSPVSDESRKIFSIVSPRLPVAILPAHEAILDAATAASAITFRWTPLTPRTEEVPRYRVQVFEVLENQTPMQAFRGNQPILDKQVIGTTQFIWHPQLPFTNAHPADTTAAGLVKQTFIWTIQTLDATGSPYGDGSANGDGRSEPVLFYVMPKKK